MAKGINLGRQLTQQELEGLSIKQLERLINKEVRFQNQLRRELESKGLEEFSESYQKAKHLAEERVVKQLPSAALVKREDFNKKKALIEYYNQVAGANRAQGASIKAAQAKRSSVMKKFGVGKKKAATIQKKMNVGNYNKFKEVAKVEPKIKELFSSGEVIDIYDESIETGRTIEEVIDEHKGNGKKDRERKIGEGTHLSAEEFFEGLF